MNLKKIMYAAVLAVAGSTALSSGAANILADSFEAGNLSETSKGRFQWSTTNLSKVVKPKSSDLLTEGMHSLQMTFPAGTSWVEQRFTLGEAHPEIWFRFWMRVPDNYEHHYHKTAESNRKFFALWMDEYSQKGNGPTVLWEFWRNSAGNGSSLSFHYSEGGYRSAGGHQQQVPFINNTDRGRWMQVALQVKASSKPTVSDGEIRLWRRWADEATFTKLHERTNAKLPIPAGGPAGWRRGYLLGWANATYREETQWHFDEFMVSTTSLLDLSENPTSPPSAPMLKVTSE